jgi:hypothetical protein
MATAALHASILQLPCRFLRVSQFFDILCKQWFGGAQLLQVSLFFYAAKQRAEKEIYGGGPRIPTIDKLRRRWWRTRPDAINCHSGGEKRFTLSGARRAGFYTGEVEYQQSRRKRGKIRHH